MVFNVVLSHFIVVYFPQMYFSSHAESIGGILSLFAKTPLSILVNGNIAVQYFFVLTGFLVSRTSFLKDITPDDIVLRSVKRYIRLLPIVAVTTLFTFLSMVLGWQKHFDIINLALNGTFLTNYCNFSPTVANLLVNIFVYPFIRSSAYVGPFWTIRYEFFGYILTMIVCHLLKRNPFRKLGYMIIAVLCFSQLSVNYVPFIFGTFVADIIYNKNPDYFEKYYHNWINRKAFVLLTLFGGMYLASCPMYFSTLHAFWQHIPKITPELVRATGVALIFFALVKLPKLQSLLSNRFFLFLGKISFDVYALHWPIMLTMQSWLFSKLLPYTSYHFASLTAFAITLPVIYIASYLLWLLVEKDRK